MKVLRHGKYNATEFASFVVKKCKSDNRTIDHLKLQKILYFIALEWFKVFREYPYKQEMEMWKLGPVIRDVYGDYRSNGSLAIKEPATKMIFENGKFAMSSIPSVQLEGREKLLVEKVIEKYSPEKSFDLVNLTHQHTPWKENEKEILANSSADLKYTEEDFKKIIKEC